MNPSISVSLKPFVTPWSDLDGVPLWPLTCSPLLYLGLLHGVEPVQALMSGIPGAKLCEIGQDIEPPLA